MFMLNSSFVALLASIPEAAITAATGSLWLFRSAGQIFGVAATGGIFQCVQQMCPALQELELTFLPHHRAVLLPALTSRLSSEPHHRRVRTSDLIAPINP